MSDTQAATDTHGAGPALPDGALLRRIEEAAVEAARAGGRLVSERFGGRLEVSRKDEAGKDLVTDVDRESQRIIGQIIAERFPGHLLLGEEEPPNEEQPAPEFVWAVDPVDGTGNFIAGLPIHAVSVGVLHLGRPAVGAVWLPWPGSDSGAILHARRGGGAWLGDRRLEIQAADGAGGPQNGRLTGLPSGLRGTFRLKVPLRRSLGEPRTMGSVVYEMSMIASGVVQLSILGPASVWDFAAGSVLVTEAEGSVVTLNGRGRWAPLKTFDGHYDASAQTTMRLRSWRGAVIAGAPAMVSFVSENLSPRRPSIMRRLRGRLRR